MYQEIVMSRIQACFAALKSQQRQALIPYITAGDPHPKYTVAMMQALSLIHISEPTRPY